MENLSLIIYIADRVPENGLFILSICGAVVSFLAMGITFERHEVDGSDYDYLFAYFRKALSCFIVLFFVACLMPTKQAIYAMAIANNLKVEQVTFLANKIIGAKDEAKQDLIDIIKEVKK